MDRYEIERGLSRKAEDWQVINLENKVDREVRDLRGQISSLESTISTLKENVIRPLINILSEDCFNTKFEMYNSLKDIERNL